MGFLGGLGLPVPGGLGGFREVYDDTGLSADEGPGLSVDDAGLSAGYLGLFPPVDVPNNEVTELAPVLSPGFCAAPGTAAAADTAAGTAAPTAPNAPTATATFFC